jgi:hypothetical protein
MYESAASTPLVSRPRRLGFTVLAALLALLLIAFGGQLVISGWFSTTDGGIHKFHELAFGVLEGVLIVGGLVASLRAPERKIAALQQVLLALAALIVAMALTGEFDPFTIMIAAVAAGLLALHPARTQLLRAGGGISPGLALVAALSGVPLLTYALNQASKQRLGSTDPHAALDHWAGMAAAAIAVLLVGLLAALKTRGFRIPAWSAGAAAVVLGLASILFPAQASTFGRLWGALAIVGGVLFISLAEREAHQKSLESPR